MIPVFDVLVGSLHKFQFLFGVVDERAEFLFLALTDFASEELVYLSFDVSRRVFQYVAKSLILSVEVGKKMLRAFGEVEYCLEVYYLGAGGSHRGKRLRQKIEVAQVAVDVVMYSWFHSSNFLSILFIICRSWLSPSGCTMRKPSGRRVKWLTSCMRRAANLVSWASESR